MENDEGVYECQISTEPKMSYDVHLKVVGKAACRNAKNSQAYNLYLQYLWSKLKADQIFMPRLAARSLSNAR